MNTDHQIDKMFRDGLGEGRIDPPPHLWGKISKGTVEVAPLNGQRHRRGMFFLISGTGLLVLTAIILFLTLPSGRKMQEQTTEESPDPLVTAQNIETTSQPVQPVHRRSENTIHPSTIKPQRNVPGALVSSESSAEKIKKSTRGKAAQPDSTATLPEEQMAQILVDAFDIQKHADDKILNVVAVSERTAAPEITETTEAVPEELLIIPDRTEEKRIPELPIGKSRNTDLKNGIARGWSSGMALHAGSLFFQTVYPPDQQIGGGLDGLAYGHLQHRRLSMGAGFGLTRFREKSPWELEVLQLDTVGTYQYVTDVNFKPVYNPSDSTITGYTAVNISTVNYPIVDTTLTVITQDAINRYTFLQIPLYLGYDFWQAENLTMTAMGGVIRNVLIAEKKPVPEYGDEKLINAKHDLGLVRKEEYWQYHLGMRVRYDLSQDWYAEGMVSYRSAFNTRYQVSAPSGKTSMVVLSAGVGFWF
jgi:hypothetical protein